MSFVDEFLNEDGTDSPLKADQLNMKSTIMDDFRKDKGKMGTKFDKYYHNSSSSSDDEDTV